MEDLIWRKSTRSSPNGGQCVEVAVANHVIYVRDSKGSAIVRLEFSEGAWSEFIKKLPV
ncbi:DUF397 domain-containing protein [Catenuloplanes indicus]|uniref:DUF397 domain-containing protein n=1 Tax=Catenuloplanes indicus TaxID=137267 RepID=A0AAE3W1B3_9ACTN|nr:DUF397 domain-containing protein [Catenuloplanes indicus]MDQ0367511.1 hypothetical protein [Catenuloplanes indicus]